MKEGTKRSIYHELATHDVVKTSEIDQFAKFKRCLQYTFGRYRIENYYEYMIVSQYYQELESFFTISETLWEEGSSKQNDTYLIYTAAKNKAEGKEYTDPYKMSRDDTIQDSTRRFKTMMLQQASDFLPYDMPKEDQLKLINKMKQVLTQKLKKQYTKQK